MKYIHKFSARIVVALVVGFLLASAGTKITYSCAPVDGAAGCVLTDKAIMYPSDLLNNKQDSLVRFSEGFAVSSLICFALLSIIDAAWKKSKLATQPKD